ncbi:peptide-N4-(N-acetyl-beta-glucosaminyl)asparagine amidase A-like [Lycium ferocissimum]|uniref:peptide-N4-(N-acetyl-beta- glucosaminyl)asparagine amidase A-like n=1 Tax=Lycium ferocissimum TaxID=112874 RepID=UPI00281662E2|nr:peptide-N4-(N-acetyl-beta-glucosaminyl)asparagine amidase A-like [Lycium ferocissimum]
MHTSINTPFLLPLLFFTFISPLSSSLPQQHQHSHFIKHTLSPTPPPHPYIEITRPLTFTTPSCTLPLFTHNFANTYNLPPVSVPYSPPPLNCSWTHVVLHFNASCKGEQYDRIAAVWLDGAEILRTSTAEPTDDGIFWTVEKDITKYTSILVKENITLSVMLENIVNDVFTGVYHVNVIFLYYDVKNVTGIELGSNVDNPISMDVSELGSLDERPADLILPVSANGDNGFWFRIKSESGLYGQRVVIPRNAYKAVMEIYVSFHGNDEFWYSNPSDSYIEMNNLTTKRGHGAYREVLLKIDGILVGSFVPFPVVFTGGINPLFWEPVVSIGAFDLPSYDIDLTPFLGVLLDDKAHFLSLGVADSIPFWLVDGNLHLWVDDNCALPCEVQAKVLDYGTPKFNIERSSSFRGLDGSFEIEMKRKSEVSGWVNSTSGNLTTMVSREVKYKNKIKFYLNGTEKRVRQNVREETIVSVLSDTGSTISRTTMKKMYPLSMTTKNLPSSENGSYLMLTDLDHEWREKKSIGGSSISLTNHQKCSGWMVVQDHDVLSGGATTEQTYSYRDEVGCYSRIVSAANGTLMNDMASSLCAASL